MISIVQLMALVSLTIDGYPISTPACRQEMIDVQGALSVSQMCEHTTKAMGIVGIDCIPSPVKRTEECLIYETKLDIWMMFNELMADIDGLKAKCPKRHD